LGGKLVLFWNEPTEDGDQVVTVAAIERVAVDHIVEEAPMGLHRTYSAIRPGQGEAVGHALIIHHRGGRRDRRVSLDQERASLRQKRMSGGTLWIEPRGALLPSSA
jgi:hypothetical protein